LFFSPVPIYLVVFLFQHGIIVVYDTTSQESFRSLVSWLTEVDKSVSDPISKLLVGNKCDLTTLRKVSTNEAQRFAQDRNLLFLETSAKTSYQVDDAFQMFAFPSRLGSFLFSTFLLNQGWHKISRSVFSQAKVILILAPPLPLIPLLKQNRNKTAVLANFVAFAKG
jgi:hypothetical protein